MVRPSDKPFYAKPWQVAIGDTIRVEWKRADVVVTRTGIVGKRSTWNNFTTLETVQGIELVGWSGNVTSPEAVTLTILNRKPNTGMEPLF